MRKHSHAAWSLLASVACLAAFFGLPARAGDLIKSFQIENQVYKLCLRADQFERAKSFDQARDLFIQAASYDPTSYSATVHSGLARCYNELKQTNQAIAEARKALTFDPKSDEALYTMALSYYDLNQFENCLKVMRQFMQVTQDAPSRAQGQEFIKRVTIFKNLDRSQALIEAGKDREAVRLLDAITVFDPSPYSGSIHASLAFALRRMGQPERAISEAMTALKYNQQDKETVYNLAIAYQDLAKFDDAIAWLRRYETMEADPELRRHAETFLNELSEDRMLLNDSANRLPDYYEQLKSKSDYWMWSRDKFPLRIYMVPPKAVRGYRPVFKTFVTRALDTWCEASGKKLNYVIVTSPAKADIQVMFTPDELIGESKDHRLKAGLTEVNAVGSMITDATVRVRTVQAFNPKLFVPDGECASTCMHEVGHALGLGHSTQIYDVMYFRSSSKQTGLPTKRDKATLARIYSSYPPLTFTPTTKPEPAGEGTKYLPPPSFVPPKAPDKDKLNPPMFMPPPLSAETTLQPPLFVPPPIAPESKPKDPVSKSEKTTPGTKPATDKDNPQFFTPPPLPR